MTILGVSLEEAEGVKDSIEKIFDIIKSDNNRLDEIKNGGDFYKKLKEYFRQWIRFVRNSNEIPSGTSFYRVRRLREKNQNGVDNISELKYPPKGTNFGRMNNGNPP